MPKVDILFEPIANGELGARPITLAPETREGFVRALAEMVAESILRERADQAKQRGPGKVPPRPTEGHTPSATRSPGDRHLRDG